MLVPWYAHKEHMSESIFNNCGARRHHGCLAIVRRRLRSGASVSMLAATGLATSVHVAEADEATDAIKTAGSTKHAIIIFGKNRSFDHCSRPMCRGVIATRSR